MRNTELIIEIYKRLPNFKKEKYTIDQCFDRCLDIQEMIERERPHLVKSDSEWPQQETGIDY